MAVLYNQLRDNFTQIPNELLTDDRLSNGAKVVYCYVASKPTGWKVWNTEIQKALNIKDKGTMSKYWKELLDTGWIDRTRTQMNNGQFSGGYDYELRITPNTENYRITEKPTYGETPTHSNTDFNSNTDINNNTNNININFEENSDISNNIKGQLFSTPDKPKKQGENQFITVIEKLSSNPKIRTALEKYLGYRRKKGLTIEQWETIITRFKNDTEQKGKNVEEVLEAIDRCLMDGNMKLFYKEYGVNKQPQPTPNSYTKPHNSNEPVMTLSPGDFVYKEFYKQLSQQYDDNNLPIIYVFEDGTVTTNL